jgi:hypothetical protein
MRGRSRDSLSACRLNSASGKNRDQLERLALDPLHIPCFQSGFPKSGLAWRFLKVLS